MYEVPFPTDILRDRSGGMAMRYREGAVVFRLWWPAGAPLFAIDRISWIHLYGWDEAS